VATTSRDNWAIGDQALYGNPYDRRTLAGILTQVKHLTGWRAEEAYCDQGFRGHSYKCEKSSHRHILRVSQGAARRYDGGDDDDDDDDDDDGEWGRRSPPAKCRVQSLEFRASA